MASLSATKPHRLEGLKDLAVMPWIEPQYDQENMGVDEFQKLKRRLEKAIPRMYHPEVAIKSFVGLDEVKEEVMVGVDNNYRLAGRILLYGPMGSGKSHLATALCTKLNALLITIDKTTFHGWSKNLNLFTKIFTELAAERNGTGTGRVVLLLENFDWFFDTKHEIDSVVSFLESVQNSWAKVSSSQLLIIGCICEPWTLDKRVVNLFQKRVYLRPLNFQERKRLIQKKACELLHGWGLDMNDQELCEVVKRAERFVGWQVCEMVEKAFRLQCPPHIKRHINPRPLIKVDFEVTLDRMSVGGCGKEILKKYEDFNKTYGDQNTVACKTIATFEDKGIQVEMKKPKRNGRILSKLFGQIEM